MDEKNPYDKMLEEISALLQMLEDNKSAKLDDSRLPTDIEQRLQKLEKDVRAFDEVGKQIMSMEFEIPEEIRNLMPPPEEDLPPEAKRIVKRGNDLMAQAKSLQSQIIEKDNSNIQQASERELPKTKKELDKGSGQKRKGKFRHMGGDWKPL